ncbi:uncharacterized protein N7500_002947 [Penicillium coprophilum]|uniref:uncharacterized protein n=1 Tax=Penicillium coprophilum TaxID=36646 RepID=UPI002389D62E|nr:uncharacterized protein N7500_002947 [Penicillium coprophilum]KAJ5170164.1 hypothetical protein N7500_002947 [Penicillium coprophilum]
MSSRNSLEMRCLADTVLANENDSLLTHVNRTENTTLSPAATITDENRDGNDVGEYPTADETFDNADQICLTYASKKILGQYIPEINEEHVRSKTRKNAASKRSKMLRNQFIAATVICVANIVLLVCVWVYFPPDSRGIGTLRMSDCSEISSINSGIHVILNVISSLFLGAGSYCMQILVSPSRREMDGAHAQGVSLDIGIQSFRNLRWIKRRRIFHWLGLGILSICLHLFWNSLFFASTPVVSYVSATVTSDFREGHDWALDPLPDWLSKYASTRDWTPVLELYYQVTNFTRLNKRDCMLEYIDPLTPKKPLVVVASNITAAENYGNTLISGLITEYDVWSRSPWWICSAYNPGYKSLCSKEWADTFIDDWVVITYTHEEKDKPGWPFEVKIDYCLVGAENANSPQCGLHYGTQVFTVVSVCTLLQCYFISLVWWSSRTKAGSCQSESTMVLMGDAIAEYLEHPGDVSSSQAVRMRQQVWCPQRRLSWFKAVSRKLVGDQWVRFLHPDGKKSLRVSTPTGMQRSSYVLSLPLTYSIALIIAMIILHWLVSESLFVVQTIGFDTNGKLLDSSSFSGSVVGYSLLPIVLATIWGGVMVIGLLVNSFARNHQDVPQEFLKWGSSSAHIESLCSRPDEDYDAHLFPLSIGVVSDSLPGGISGPPRLSFSTDIHLRLPQDGEVYMLPARKEKRFEKPPGHRQ